MSTFKLAALLISVLLLTLVGTELLVKFSRLPEPQGFAPQHEQAQAYNENTVKNLEDLQMQYLTAPTSEKVALKSIILRRFSTYPLADMPADSQNFYENLTKGGRLEATHT